jgi:hypothetical protein
MLTPMVPVVQRVIGALLILVGAVWVVQGFGIMSTGSFMDGNALWGVIGLGCIAVGVFTIGYERYRRLRRAGAQHEGEGADEVGPQQAPRR